MKTRLQQVNSPLIQLERPQQHAQPQLTVQNKQLNSIFKSQYQRKFLKTHFSKEDIHITNAPTCSA